MNIRVAVVGNGLMGRGVIQAYASKGFHVVSIKRREDDNRLLDYLKREYDRERLTKEEYDTILGNIEITTDLNQAATCQLVIENINEIVEQKQELLKKLDEICPPDVILASNTSSISIGKLGSVTKRKDKIVGLHYMSPVPVMKLVEVVKSMDTSDETIKFATEITEKIDKIPIVVKDFPGFVVSRLVAALINEAANIYQEGVADVEEIDKIAKLGMNLPMGPMQLADEIGLDIAVNTMDSLFQSFKDPKYRVCPQIRMLCENGYLGKKTGKGFYTYKK